MRRDPARSMKWPAWRNSLSMTISIRRSVSRTIRKAGKVDDGASRSKMEKESRTMGDDWSPEFFSSVVEEKFILNFDNLWACLAFR